MIIPRINYATSSSCMKLIFILLCITLCFVSFIFYYHATINWKMFNVSIINDIFLPDNQSEDLTLNDQNSLYTNRRFVIFACSIHSTIDAYLFYTPIIASSWKRLGYETIIIFVGDFTLPNILTSRLNLTRNYLQRLGVTIIDMQCPAFYAIKISQLVRVFSGFLPNSIVDDDDDIITSDSDLMPIKPRAYIPKAGTDGFIFNAFCCGTFKRREKTYRMFPMGHIYLKKKSWRALVIESKQRTELLLLNQTQNLLNENASLSFELISLYTRHEFKNTYDSTMKKGDSAWYMDQILCSMLITDYREKHKDFQIHERDRGKRLDRSQKLNYWDRKTFDEFVDAHLFHDVILTEHYWKTFNNLLQYLFKPELVQLLNDYYRQYVIAGKQ